MNAPIIDPLQGDFPEVIEEYLQHGLMKCISFNRRGTLLAAGCSDGSCIIWDFETRGIAKELRDKDCVAPITSVCWSKYGHHILVSAADKSLTLWDVGEAAVPGTTLGILRIGGILSAKAKLYDTPGLLHPYLMSMRLSREEQKLIEIRKEIRPRTYRIKPGQTVHVGALMRLDLNQASVQTIYVTIWASPNVSLHMGKTENADDIFGKHAGVRLQPPIGAERLSELGKWKDREIKVSGTSWDVNSVDIAVAGLGWFSLGLKGEATLKLWMYEGVEVSVREPLILDRAPFLERPGFWLPKAISDAIGSQTKADAQERGRKPRI